MAKVVEDNVRLDNLKAQYNSILGNIAIANKKLEKLLEQITKKEAFLKATDDAIADRSKIVSDAIRREGTIRRRIAELGEKTENITKFNQELQNKNDEVISSYKQQEKELSYKVKEINEKIESILKKKSLVEDEFNTLMRDKDDLDQKIIVSKETLELIQNETIKEKKESVEKKESAKKELKKLDKELCSKKELVEEEKKKLQLPKENLEERIRQVEEKEKDIRIITRRLKELWQEVKPGIELKI